MAAERIIGIDFGTSTSVIRVKRFENGEPLGDRLDTKAVTFNMGVTMTPTLIQKLGNAVYYGHEAETPRKGAETYRDFKVDLESVDEATRSQARALTEEFFVEHLAKKYREQSDAGHLGEASDRERTIVSYPVKWSDETKRFMVETAKKAGFRNVEGMDEAQAAIQAVTVQNADILGKKGYFKLGVPVNILLIDMGAGTTDFVLCRHTPGSAPKTEILCTYPRGGAVLFGGREVDEILQKHLFEKLPKDTPREILDKIYKRSGVEKFKIWKETIVSKALQNNETVTDFSEFEYTVDAYDIDMEAIHLDRTAFEACAETYLRQFPELVNGCLKEAEDKAPGCSGGDIDLVILTGGHSQWYFAREMLAGNMPRFGDMGLSKIAMELERIVPIPLPQETVALGLAFQGMPCQITEQEQARASKTERVSIDSAGTPTNNESQAGIMLAQNISAQPIDERFKHDYVMKKVDGGYEIVAYNGREKNVVIPSEYQGLPVIGIGMSAFFRGKGHAVEMEEVTLPESCRYIGEYAFCMCKSLKNIVLPDGLQKIGNSAFAYGHGLKVIEIPASCSEIGDGAFFCQLELHTVKIPPNSKLYSLEKHTFVFTKVSCIKLPVSCQCNKLEKTMEKKLFEPGTGDFLGLFNKPTPPEYIKITRYE